MEKTARLFNVQPFSLQDGPGTRTTVFFKGCNLRCWWCHNPESWDPKPELMFYPNRCIGCGMCAQVCPHRVGDGRTARFTLQCTACGACARECYAEAVQMVGREWSMSELMDELLASKDLFDHSGGGVTFSGGEPLLQADFLFEALARLREAGIHTAVESALNVDPALADALFARVDMLFSDIKCMDSARHRLATGVGNERILANIRRASASGVRLCVRTPIVPGFNDDVQSVRAIADFVCTLPHPPAVELLAFHGLCSGKYEALNRRYQAIALKTPDPKTMQSLCALFEARDLQAIYRQ